MKKTLIKEKKKSEILKAIYGSNQTKIKFGIVKIPCYVLEDGQRVLSGKGLQDSVGFYKNASGTSLRKFLTSTRIAELIPIELQEKLNNRIAFYRKGAGGCNDRTYGYDATILIDICDVITQAKKYNKLTKGKDKLYQQAEIIMRSVAKVGIIGLIDEATGYQNIRMKDALQKLLDKYLSKEYANWAKKFPYEFFQEMFRLNSWKMKGKTINGPRVAGRYINDIVYSRLAPDILEELKCRTPKDDKGKNKIKYHQWLTEDIGHPALSQHIHTLIALMKASNDWKEFSRLLERALPKKELTLIPHT